MCRIWRVARGTGRSITPFRRSASLLLSAALLAFGCDGPPAAPSGPPDGPEPTMAAVSVEIEPTTARVGSYTTQTYRLTAPLDHDVDVWTEVTPPTGDSYESGPIDFTAGTTTRVFTSGILSADKVGDWTMRIVEDRLPAGVVLGNPSTVTWSVVQ